MAAFTVNSALVFLLFSFSFSLAPICRSSRPSLLKAVDSAPSNDDDSKCVYTIYVRTGSFLKAGTDSVISLALAGADGLQFQIEDLVSWGGLMGPDHDYFERGNLDIFSGRGPCSSSWPPCWMNLTSDGSGPHHGWYCNYVEVTTTGPHMGCSQQLFTVEQWLARDASPWQLYAIRDLCSKADAEIASGSHATRVE